MHSETITVLLATDDHVDRSLVESILVPDAGVNVAGLLHGFDDAAAMDDPTAQLLIVACGETSQEAADLVGRWSAEHRDRPVVALCESVPDYFVQMLFQAGADDVVKLPETPERVVFSLEKALARHKGRETAGLGEQAPMVCVLGPKGGTGKTVTASNLAVGFASRGLRTAIVDLDLQFGDVGLALGLQPQHTVYDLATSGGALDAEKLGAYLTRHESGVAALLGPLRPDQASAVSTELMRSVYAHLRATHDVVVVDTPPDFTPHVIAAIDVSSHLCMVGMLDSLSLKNTKLGLETLDLMGYDPGAISLVLNRANSNVGLTREDVAAIVGRTPDVLVPSDRDVPRSINEGAPVITARKRSPVASAYRELGDHYLARGIARADRPTPNGTAAPDAQNGAQSNGNGNGSGPEEAGERRRRIRLVTRRGA
jgi:pilus assembly protein CpaE